MNHNVSLSGVLLNFDGKPRQFGKNRAFHFEKKAPRRIHTTRTLQTDIVRVSKIVIGSVPYNTCSTSELQETARPSKYPMHHSDLYASNMIHDRAAQTKELRSNERMRSDEFKTSKMSSGSQELTSSAQLSLLPTRRKRAVIGRTVIYCLLAASLMALYNMWYSTHGINRIMHAKKLSEDKVTHIAHSNVPNQIDVQKVSVFHHILHVVVLY